MKRTERPSPRILPANGTPPEDFLCLKKIGRLFGLAPRRLARWHRRGLVLEADRELPGAPRMVEYLRMRWYGSEPRTTAKEVQRFLDATQERD